VNYCGINGKIHYILHVFLLDAKRDAPIQLKPTLARSARSAAKRREGGMGSILSSNQEDHVGNVYCFVLLSDEITFVANSPEIIFISCL